ncbi:hypothetical protein D3H65_00610 [Paraflavitalea soli]|uniref:Uncharacterized protein n=1 Tax=Paraflavitalea soli TaxID=2315862 RepID=A0A3B7MLT4_9BACT|nr:hypothetical protein [Paraflavitalea soli]AXY72565.1 hypothetical protein D3H65_00610 [Paraflavitalea soli]
METIKQAAYMLGVLLLSVRGFSQNGDSTNVPKQIVAYAADKFSNIRPLNFEFAHAGPYNFTANRGSVKLPGSKVNSFTQAKTSATLVFIKRKTWMLGTSLGYKYTNGVIALTDPASGSIRDMDGRAHYFSASANFTRFSTLFNKKAVYYARLIVDGSDKYVERVKGLISGALVLKANERTKITAGLLLNIDPSSQVPVTPVFSYEHKFGNGLMADFTLPKNGYLRKRLFNGTGRVSLGMEMEGTSFYLYNFDGTPQKYEYRQMDINAGVVYEHALGGFIITAKTGIKITPSGRIFRKEDSFAHPVYKTKPDPAFYCSVGVSYNPFTFLQNKK